MTPKEFAWLGPVGAALLVIGVIAGPAIAGGDAVTLFAVAGLGFLVWLAFLIVTGVRLVRTANPPDSQRTNDGGPARSDTPPGPAPGALWASQSERASSSIASPLP